MAAVVSLTTNMAAVASLTTNMAAVASLTTNMAAVASLTTNMAAVVSLTNQNGGRGVTNQPTWRPWPPGLLGLSIRNSDGAPPVASAAIHSGRQERQTLKHCRVSSRLNRRAVFRTCFATITEHPQLPARGVASVGDNFTSGKGSIA
ncbi:hypothetical protein Bbelb_098920 [Branchiostoma belcheri]|nr:hypothetical protein Bbelb_098920 [Branchiostoma belcheri]